VADNAQPGGTGDVYRTKDRAGVETQIVGLDVNIGGATEALMSSANPMPVNIAGSAGSGTQTSQALTAAGAATLAGATSGASAYVLDVSAAGNASFHILATAFVGTVVFEQSFDAAGAAGTWAPVPCIPEDATSAPMSTLTINTATAYIRQFTQGMFGPKLFRVRCSAFTSGSLVVLGSGGPGWVEPQPALGPSDRNIGRAGPWTSSASVITSVTPAASSYTLLAANTNRIGYKITNDSNVDCLVNETGGTASATAYSFRLKANGGYYESSGTNMVYVGAVTAIGVTAGSTTGAAATSGACRVTEFS